MNLQQTLNIYAGGEGSGCRGPNCGRPEKEGKEGKDWKQRAIEKREAAQIERIKKQQESGKKYRGPGAKPLPVTMKEDISPKPISLKRKHKDLPVGFNKPWKDPKSKFTDVRPKPTEEEMRKWKEQHPTAKKLQSPVQEGDLVRLKIPETLWNTKTGNLDKFKAGQLQGRVIHVLPPTGGDQLVKIQILPPTKNHEIDDVLHYKKLSDVELIKQGALTKQTLRPASFPIRQSDIKMQTVTKDGANLTWVKSPGDKERSERELKELSKTPHRYKGQFELMDKINSPEGERVTRLYDTSKLPARAWEQEGPSAASKSGATVWVHRYADKVIIQEFNYLRWSNKFKGIVSFEYKDVDTKFGRLNKALGTLNKRYGIKISSKEPF